VSRLRINRVVSLILLYAFVACMKKMYLLLSTLLSLDQLHYKFQYRTPPHVAHILMSGEEAKSPELQSQTVRALNTDPVRFCTTTSVY
jgi:hypothetical protein